MKTITIILVVMVFGRCALSGSNESGDKDAKCKPHQKFKRIHPAVLLAFMYYEKDLVPLKDILFKYWEIAVGEYMPQKDADKAIGFLQQFNDQLDTIYAKDEKKIEETTIPALLKLQKTLYPNLQLDKVFGRCALSGSNESSDKEANCKPHQKFKRIHPAVLLAFIYYEKDLVPLKDILLKYWEIAVSEYMPEKDADMALGFLQQFNDQLDTIYAKDEKKIEETTIPALLKLQKTLYPNLQLDKVSCDDKPAFVITVVDGI